MKYIIKESQFNNLKSSVLNEFHYIHSKQFEDHKGPNITLAYNGSPKSLQNRISKHIEKSSKILVDELSQNDNILPFEQFLEKTIDNIIEVDGKRFFVTDMSTARNFLSLILSPELKKLYYKVLSSERPRK
jgi:hypothetical protein